MKPFLGESRGSSLRLKLNNMWVQLLISFSFFTRGGKFIPSAVQVFKAKIILHVLYRALIWFLCSKCSFEGIQSPFLRVLFGVPKCVSGAVLKLEAELNSVNCLAWIYVIYFWLCCKWALPTNFVVSKILLDHFESPWSKAVTNKINSGGLSSPTLLSRDLASAKSIVKQRLLDIDMQDLQSPARVQSPPSP